MTNVASYAAFTCDGRALAPRGLGDLSAIEIWFN